MPIASKFVLVVPSTLSPSRFPVSVQYSVVLAKLGLQANGAKHWVLNDPWENNYLYIVKWLEMKQSKNFPWHVKIK